MLARIGAGTLVVFFSLLSEKSYFTKTKKKKKVNLQWVGQWTDYKFLCSSLFNVKENRLSSSFPWRCVS